MASTGEGRFEVVRFVPAMERFLYRRGRQGERLAVLRVGPFIIARRYNYRYFPPDRIRELRDQA